MSAIAELGVEPPLSLETYLAFLSTRAHEERWQLIDGVPVMMERPLIRHQLIRTNVALQLANALEKTRPDLTALHGIALSFDGHPDFLPMVDVAVVELPADDRIFTSRFFLAAEVLSHTDTEEHIDLKVERYAEQEHNLYTVLIAQTEMRVELSMRESGWHGTVLRGDDAVLELPEFGFRCALRDLYTNTTVQPA